MKYIYIILLSLFVYKSAAQTVVWQMQPTDYSEITLINSNLYKVVRNGKIGLIHSDGTIVAPTENDNISDFYEGKALVTVNDGHGERINGCLTENGKYYLFTNKFYTLSGQKFFSDGVISVANEQGKVGYINESGTIVYGFDGKYDKIKPFVEGYAAVFKNKKYYLIDKDGTPVHFSFKTVGEVFGGTNVYNGIVYVWDTEGKFYTYDVNKDSPCRSVKTPQNIRSLDYLYRFSSITGKDKNIPFVNKKYNGGKGINPTEHEGLFGYKNGESIILPYQFNNANQFEDGNAVVGINGKLGIIHYVEGSGFSVAEIKKSISFYAGRRITCQFNLMIPEIWRNSNLQIALKDQNGISVETTYINNSYSFTQSFAASCKKEYCLTISGDGLKLYEGKLSYSFTKKEICPICGGDKDICKGYHPAKCAICGKDKDRCSGHPKICPTCHKKISECKYRGDH